MRGSIGRSPPVSATPGPLSVGVQSLSPGRLLACLTQEAGLADWIISRQIERSLNCAARSNRACSSGVNIVVIAAVIRDAMGHNPTHWVQQFRTLAVP